MNNPHLIDHAIFDTAYSDKAVASDRRREIDDFARNDLMNVVDEVFNRIDRDSGNPDAVFRIDKLEIDLGDIPYRDFRQQMPRKLREKLLSALREVRYSAAGQPLTNPGPIDSKSDAQAQLFYFLRNGYLPWYSRLTDANALESLLIDTIDSAPAVLIEFMRDHVQRARVLERLGKQFTKPAVKRITELLRSSGGAANERVANVGDLEMQLVFALLSGDTALAERAWQPLYAGHPDLLEKILRYYAQQAIVRHNIVSGFSPALFNELLRLLAPAAHEVMQVLIDHAEIFQPVDGEQARGRLRQTTELRAFALAYLLAEPGGRVSKKSYLASLLRHLSTSDDRNESQLLARLIENAHRHFASDKPAGDLSRLLTELDAEMTARMAIHKDAPSSDVTERLAGDADSPLSAVKARVASSKESPPSDVNARAAADNDTLSGETKNQAGPHEQYERVMSALAIAGADRAYSDSSLLGDIKILARDAPHWLMRLFGELQTGRHAWLQAIESLPAPVLAELTYAFLSSNPSSDLAISSGSGSNLLSAIQSHAEKSHDRQAFFMHILSCLIKDEVIDFGAIRSGAPLGTKPAATPGCRARPVPQGDHQSGHAAGSGTTADVDWGEADQGQAEEPAPLENIYIANAGAVLFAPYLPRLFERLGLVDQAKFKNRDAAEHGVHCVQFLVNESISSPEYQLVLNKLLCGIRPGLPIRRSIELAAGEQEQLEALLHAITQHWKPLANTSIAGLRESFLQRNGRLQLKGDAWHLAVEARPFDMLLDQIPWSFSTIKFPWMDRVIYVEWR